MSSRSCNSLNVSTAPGAVPRRTDGTQDDTFNGGQNRGHGQDIYRLDVLRAGISSAGRRGAAFHIGGASDSRRWLSQKHTHYVGGSGRRRKMVFGRMCPQLRRIFYALARHKECQTVWQKAQFHGRTFLGPGATQCPRSGLNWNKSASTSGSKKKRMEAAESSDVVNQGALQRDT